MIKVSNALRAGIDKNFREERLTGLIILKDGSSITFGVEDIVQDSTGLTSVLGGDSIEFGAIIVREFAISIYSDKDRYLFSNGKLTVSYGLKVNGEWEEIRLGVFDIVEAERNGKIVKIIAYSPLKKLDHPWDNVAIGGTPYELLDYICDKRGIELGQTKAEIETFINSTDRVHFQNDMNLRTFRDCIRAVAQLLGAFVDTDPEGRMVLKRFGKTPVHTIKPKGRYSSNISDYIVRHNLLKVHGKSEIFIASNPDITPALAMELSDAPMWKAGLPARLQLRCDNLFYELSQIEYTPCNLSVVGDISLECGDMVTIDTGKGELINTLIMAITWNFRGKMSVESKGSNPHFVITKPKSEEMLNDISKRIEQDKLIFYEMTNSGDLKIGSGTEIEVGTITFTTTDVTTIMFLAEGLVNSTATGSILEEIIVKDSTGKNVQIMGADHNPLSFGLSKAKLEVFYYLNDILIDYKPVDELIKGEHIVNLFYSIKDMEANKVNKFKVKMKSTGGEVTIPRGKFKSIIVGQGLAATIAWDGTLEVKETFEPWDLSAGLVISDLTETVTVSQQIPRGLSITDVISNLELKGLAFPPSDLTDRVLTSNVITKQTLFASMLSKWSYNSKALEVVDSKIKFRTSWEMEGVIDSTFSGEGAVYKIPIELNDIATVTSLTITNPNGITTETDSAVDGMDVIRNNSNSDEGVDSFQAPAWLKWNGVPVDTIYVSSNSYIGLGQDAEMIKVNRTDAANYYVYKKEADEYVKIRWVGYSKYNETSEAYSLIYDVYLWKNEDISIAFRNIPTSYDTGDKIVGNTSFNMDKASPFIHFKKLPEGYEVNYTPTILLDTAKYLLRRGPSIYKLAEGQLVVVDGEYNGNLFNVHGMTTSEMGDLSSLTAGGDFEVLLRIEGENLKTPSANIIGTATAPQVIKTNDYDMSHSSILGVEKAQAAASPGVLYAVSFDSGATFKVRNNNEWVNIVEDSSGMTADVLTAITQAEWGEVTTEKFSYKLVLPTIDDYFDNLIMDYLN